LPLFSLRQRFHDLVGVVDEKLRHWTDRPIFQGHDSDRPLTIATISASAAFSFCQIAQPGMDVIADQHQGQRNGGDDEDSCAYIRPPRVNNLS
jgi:hypothetical protein